MANLITRNTFYNGSKENAREKDTGVMPSEILDDLNQMFGHNQTENDKLRNILIHIVYALDLLNKKTNANKELLTKLDLLTATLQNGNTELQQSHEPIFEQDFEDIITRKKDLQWKCMRSEQLSVYYDELLSRDAKPYIPFKFRSKVSRNIPAYEKPIKQEKSINNVKVEIRLMKETMETCKKELEQLSHEIKSFLESPTLQREMKVEYTTQMLQNEETNKRNWRATFHKIKSRYEKDMDSGADQYLLRYSDEENIPNYQDNHDQYKSREKEYPLRYSDEENIPNYQDNHDQYKSREKEYPLRYSDEENIPNYQDNHDQYKSREKGKGKDH